MFARVKPPGKARYLPISEFTSLYHGIKSLSYQLCHWAYLNFKQRQMQYLVEIQSRIALTHKDISRSFLYCDILRTIIQPFKYLLS